MLIPVNPDTLKKAIDKALDIASDEKVRNQLASLHCNLYYGKAMAKENVPALQYVLLTPEEIKLVLELIPLEGLTQKI